MSSPIQVEPRRLDPASRAQHRRSHRRPGAPESKVWPEYTPGNPRSEARTPHFTYIRGLPMAARPGRRGTPRASMESATFSVEGRSGWRYHQRPVPKVRPMNADGRNAAPGRSEGSARRPVKSRGTAVTECLAATERPPPKLAFQPRRNLRRSTDVRVRSLQPQWSLL